MKTITSRSTSKIQGLFRQHFHQFYAAIAITPFVVVPADHLYEPVPKRKRQFAVENAGVWIAYDVLRNERFVAIFEHAFVAFVRRGFFERRINRIHSRVLLQHGSKICDRAVRGRHAERAAVQFPFQFRNYFADRLGSARGRRNDVDRRRSRASQILMRKIEDALVVRVTVYGAHESMRDSELVMQNLRHRRETIRSAARVGNNLVLLGIVDVVVHPDTNRYVGVFRWRADQHSFGACF